MSKSVFKVCSLFLLISGCQYLGDPLQASDVLLSGTIKDKKVAEASGIAISRRNNQLLWINNDSGNPATIYALNQQGTVVASVKITGVKNRDWEDVASFGYQGKPYLLVADVGDNDAQWSSYSLHIIAEPKLDPHGPATKLKVKPAWSIEFTYPNGQHDCESVAVDMQNHKVLLLTKREEIPQLFELDLLTRGKQVATSLGEISPLPKASNHNLSLMQLFNFATMPTGMDISSDGNSLVLITYASAYQYVNPDHQPWSSIMKQTPAEIPLPKLKQAEAIGFDQTGHYIFVTSEKLPAPIIRMDSLIPKS